MYCISIGYPLGVRGTDFVVETQNADVKLTPDEALCWVNCQGMNAFNGVSDIMKQLECYGVLCTGETYDDLYKKINTQRPIRQGCGSYYEGKCVIYLNEDFFCLTQIQYSIWKFANSRRTIDQIWMLIRQFKVDITVNDYMKNIGILIKENLIFLE